MAMKTVNKRRIRRLLLLAILIGATFFSLLLLMPSDEAPPADDDLLHRETESGSGSNGVDHLRRIDALDLEGIWKFVESEELWSSANWTPELVQTTLNKTEPFYRTLQECLSAERFVSPEVAYYTESYRWLVGVNDLATYVLLRARALFAQGKEKEAFVITLDVLRFARRVENCGGSVYVYLAGKGLSDGVYEQFVVMLQETGLSSDELCQVNEALITLAWRPDGYRMALRAEYGVFVNLITQFMDGTVTPLQIWEDEFGRLSGLRKLFAPLTLRFRLNETVVRGDVSISHRQCRAPSIVLELRDGATGDQDSRDAPCPRE